MITISGIELSPKLRPLLNIGEPYDLLTGNFAEGENGMHYINGGLNNVSGTGGRGNAGKSLVQNFMALSVLGNYPYDSSALFADQEPPALSHTRIVSLSKRIDGIKPEDFLERKDDEGNPAMPRIARTDSTIYPGEKLLKLLEDQLHLRETDKSIIKKQTRYTPFLNHDNSNIGILSPFIPIIDSLSAMPFTHIENLANDKEIGDKSNNTLEMRASKAKSDLINKFARMPAATGSYWMTTAHMGDKIEMDPHAPPQRKLAFMNSITFKRVPENYTILLNNLQIVALPSPLVDKDKRPLYPFPKALANEDKDLVLSNVMMVRNKTGPSGYVLPLVVSQSQGVLIAPSYFHMCRTMGNDFGINVSPNKQDFSWQLMPEVTFTRKNLIELHDGNYALLRAGQITVQLLQMKIYPHLQATCAEYMRTPTKLYNAIKELGYDWDILLGHTTSRWAFKRMDKKGKKLLNELETYKEYGDNRMPLTALDLLKMAAGEFRPYWYDEYVSLVKAKPADAEVVAEK